MLIQLVSSNMLTRLFLILVMVLCTSATTLLPYGGGNDNRFYKGSIPFRTDQGTQTPRFVDFDISANPITMFKKKRSMIRIFETGVITYRKVPFPLCPTSKVTFADPYIAAYWVQADLKFGGNVYYRQDLVTDANKDSYQSLVEEINRGQEDYAPPSWKLDTGDLTSIIVITWENMRPSPLSFLRNPNHVNTFQLVIVSTAARSYALILYKRLDYYFVHETQFVCGQAAIVGEKADDQPQYSFELTRFFYLQPYNLLLHSTIKDFSNLRRYLFFIERVKTQPLPPYLNCNVPKADKDPYCEHGVPPFFCLNSPPGLYSHPSDCSKFVQCGNGGTMNIESCGQLYFNPFFQNCDWAGYYSCNVGTNNFGAFQSDFRIANFKAVEEEGFRPLISIREEIDRNQNVAFHNNTCFGVPEWGNTIDISSCEHYLMCSNTRTYRLPCPLSWNDKPLVYNREKNQCDYRRNVKCTNGIRPYVRTTTFVPSTSTVRTTRSTTTVIYPDEICVGRSGNIVDPASCSRYYTCAHGRPIARQNCQKDYKGDDLFFNPKINACDHQYNVVCRRACYHHHHQEEEVTYSCITDISPQ